MDTINEGAADEPLNELRSKVPWPVKGALTRMKMIKESNLSITPTLAYTPWPLTSCRLSGLWINVPKVAEQILELQRNHGRVMEPTKPMYGLVAVQKSWFCEAVTRIRESGKKVQWFKIRWIVVFSWPMTARFNLIWKLQRAVIFNNFCHPCGGPPNLRIQRHWRSSMTCKNVVKFHECAFWNSEEGAHPLWGPNLRNFKWPLEDRSR